MASGNEDFLFADDFDVIMAILEEDENVEEQFLEAVQEVSIKLAPKKCDRPFATVGHVTDNF